MINGFPEHPIFITIVIINESSEAFESTPIDNSVSFRDGLIESSVPFVLLLLPMFLLLLLLFLLLLRLLLLLLLFYLLLLQLLAMPLPLRLRLTLPLRLSLQMRLRLRKHPNSATALLHQYQRQCFQLCFYTSLLGCFAGII